MRRTKIKPKQLYQLTKEYYHPEFESSGGRPRTYDDALIIAIASIQNLYSFSFREALEFCEEYFDKILIKIDNIESDIMLLFGINKKRDARGCSLHCYVVSYLEGSHPPIGSMIRVRPSIDHIYVSLGRNPRYPPF